MDNTFDPSVFTPANLVAEAMQQLSEVKTTPDFLKDALVRPTDEIAPPDYLIKYNEAPICSLGDFSLITGKAKSRKTLLISLFVAAMISRNGIEGLTGSKYGSKCQILWFDTEQSRYHAQKALIRAIRCAGVGSDTLDHVRLYCLRPFSPQERVDIINEAIVNQNPHSNIAFVVIDGIRDLITDINNPEQATTIATRLMKWTESKHLHIMTLLHQNKGDSNARGHVGTELVNKAQTVISVEVAKGCKDISNVNPEQTREQPFDPFSIAFDGEGLPCIGEVVEDGKSDSKRTIEPHSLEITVHENLCANVFEDQGEFSYPEMIRGVRLAFDKMGTPIGDSKAKLMLTHWVKLGFVKNCAVKGAKARYQKVSP